MAKSSLLSLYQIQLDDTANTSMAWEAVFYTETSMPINLPKFKTNAHTQSGQKSSLIDPLGANENHLLCHISPTHVAAIWRPLICT